MTGSPTGRYDAIVLAGGTSRRMGGGDKTVLDFGGMSLLDRAVEAVSGAAHIIVVGTQRPIGRQVIWTREDPPGGGPAAAVAAGLAIASAPLVVLLAADLPFVTGATIARLIEEVKDTGAVLVDAGGQPQWLLGAWPIALLQMALAGDQTGRSLRSALAPLTPALISSGSETPEWFDCDKPADLTAARELLDG